MKDFLQVLYTRKSVRTYKKHKIKDKELKEIIKIATTSPSCFNLQPWRFIIVNSEENKLKMKEVMKYNLKQLETSSALICLFGDTKAHNNINIIYDEKNESEYIQKLTGIYSRMSKDNINNIIRFDCGLITMQLVLVAKYFGYDTNIIGGFDYQKINDVLNVDSSLTPIAVISIGKRDEEPKETTRLDISKVLKIV